MLPKCCSPDEPSVTPYCLGRCPESFAWCGSPTTACLDFPWTHCSVLNVLRERRNNLLLAPPPPDTVSFLPLEPPPLALLPSGRFSPSFRVGLTASTEMRGAPPASWPCDSRHSELSPFRGRAPPALSSSRAEGSGGRKGLRCRESARLTLAPLPPHGQTDADSLTDSGVAGTVSAPSPPSREAQPRLPEPVWLWLPLCPSRGVGDGVQGLSACD